MELRPRYTTSTETKVVCKLQQALYGLKQSPRAWFGRFSLEEIRIQAKQLRPYTIYKHKVGKYVLDILTEVGMLVCKPVDTPIVQNHILEEYSDQAPTDKRRYQRLVGKLMYLSHTRPNIAYVVSIVSQFMHNPSEDHMDAVIRILRYLKFSPGKGLLFSKNGHLRINASTDADWTGNISDRRSTSGYFMFVGGNLVT
ncbi:Retrovirus-related Pol polyprotein from transposon RE1 [Vitis vinifera]|uniref:Retrovirus-related Pol polyprotein from transposon RE1 n=1 Tax=Vitis vinifera TaxID=29760 RepID=A0A438EMR4_VITVI|nr:Retrovirus-related Pol polyprotein from transposon RE1 [Vitis vinifera]